MTQEEEELLLRDLCGRLSYGVKVYRKWISPLSGSPEEGIFDFCIFDIEILLSPYNWVSTEKGIREVREYDIKPYLFPLSSMTKEQLFEVQEILGKNEIKIEDGFLRIVDSNRNTISYLEIFALLEWFYKNQFDVYGLIPMGLAKDATGLNIY